MALSGSERIAANDSRLVRLLVVRFDGQAARERRSSNLIFRAACWTSTRSPRRADNSRSGMLGTLPAGPGHAKSVIHTRDRMSSG